MSIYKMEGGEITYNYLMRRSKHALAREYLTLVELYQRKLRLLESIEGELSESEHLTQDTWKQLQKENYK